MAFAVCMNCGAGVEWFAGKGFKLKNLKCPKCGGKLKGCSLDVYLKTKERFDLATSHREYARGMWEI